LYAASWRKGKFYNCCSHVRCSAGFSRSSDPADLPFLAGGPNDIIARVIDQRMSELLKQPVNTGGYLRVRAGSERLQQVCGHGWQAISATA
jgi:hypothetical protein